MVRPRLPASLLALALVLSAPAPAAAFDTGHHFDVIAATLADEGFAPEARREVQVANWLADYANNPVYPDKNVQRRFSGLHFDDLATDEEVRTSWARLIAGTRAAVRQTAAAGDSEGLLVVLGLSLHAVQDFYSHSNWVDLHPREAGGPFRTETFFSDPHPGGALRTCATPEHAPAPWLAHGDYFHGMNKDSPRRKGWHEAYVFAHAASREWVAAARGWAEAARPGSWSAATAWAPSPLAARALRQDALAAKRISMWSSGGPANWLRVVQELVPTGADGHWKGNGSGSVLGTALMTLVGPNPRYSHVMARATALAPLLEGTSAQALDAAPQVAGPAIAGGHATDPAPGRMLGQVVTVRTLSVRALTPTIDVVGQPDFFARVRVGNETFVEAPMLERASPLPKWTAMAVVPGEVARVPIRYALLDQDYPGPDEVVDLTGSEAPARFWFEPATGRVGGLPFAAEQRRDAHGTHVLLRGREAEVWLCLTGTRLSPPTGGIGARATGI